MLIVESIVLGRGPLMFLWDTYEYRIKMDAFIFGGGIMWPFAELIGTCAALIWGLISIWLVRGRGHWFLRCLPLIALVCWMMWVSAYDLAVVAIIQMAVIVVGISIRQPWNRNFTLRDAMLATAVVSLVCGFLVAVPDDTWLSWKSILWFGCGFGLVVLFADYLVTRDWSAKKRLLTSIVIPYATILTLVLLLLERMRKHHSRWTRVALGAILTSLCVPVVWAMTTLSWRSPIPSDSGGGQEGVRLLCEAGNAIPETRFRPFPTTEAALERATTASAEELQLAGHAMTLPCRLSVNYQLSDPGDFNKRVPQRDPFINLCRALHAEAQLALLQNRVEESLAHFAESLRLCRCLGRGGLPFDTSLASELHSNSLVEIYAMRNRMTIEQRQAWIDLLLDEEQAFEPTPVLLRRRQAWEARVAPWQDRLMLRYLEMLGISPVHVELYLKNHKLQLRLLRLSLALENYRATNGAYPVTLDELRPDYLAEIPKDPLTGEELRYRIDGNSFRLYGIGRDGRDNDGNEASFPYLVTAGDLTPDVVFQRRPW